MDCSIIWAWFKDCRFANVPRYRERCRRHKKRDGDASWTWDDHWEHFVYGYKAHIAIDVPSGLPLTLTVTRAGITWAILHAVCICTVMLGVADRS